MAIDWIQKNFGSILVWISSQGRIDYKGILHSVSKKDFSRSMIYLMETMSREIQLEKELTGRLITQQTCIFDVAELSMRILSHKPSRFIELFYAYKFYVHYIIFSISLQ